MVIIPEVSVAVRTLAKQPAFVAVSVFTLAIAIGGATAIFSIVDAALLRPLPYPEPDRLVDVLVETRRANGEPSAMGPSFEDVERWQADGRVFSHVAMWRGTRRMLIDGPQLQEVRALDISPQYLGVFGVRPLIGREFTVEDTRQGAPDVVMLSHAFWQAHYAGDSGVLGQSIRLDNQPATVVGVLPAGFRDDTSIWRPLRLSPEMFARRGIGGRIQGRLHAGVSIEQAKVRLNQLSGTAAAPGAGDTRPIRVTSLYEYTVQTYRQTVGVAAGATLLILLIACINVGCLLLARGTTRRAEIAVRLALGASRVTVMRQLLTESLVLAVTGGVLGALLARVALPGLLSILPLTLPPDAEVAIDGRVLVAGIGLSLLTGMLFGLAPALRLSRVSMAAAIGQGDRRHSGGLSRRSGQTLVAVEVAVALVLLAGAGLMIRSFAAMLAVETGVDLSSVVTMQVIPADRTPAAAARFFPALLDAVRESPGVEIAGAVDHVTMGLSSTNQAAVVDGNKVFVSTRQFDGDYFTAMGMTLRSGRWPTATEGRMRPVAVVSSSAAHALFGSDHAVGRRLEVQNTPFEVIGVVNDLRHMGPVRPAEPEVFLAFGHLPARDLTIVVKSTLPFAALSGQLRATAESVGPRSLINDIRRGESLLFGTISIPQRRTWLLGTLGSLAVLLCCVGILGTTGYAVARRTREIGVRMAFGATGGRVIGTMVRDAAFPIAAGIVAGVLGAMQLTPLIGSFLFGITPHDPPTLLAMCAAMGLLALLAAWIPARRAARVDPVQALRVE
jgi:predicted permease